MLVHCLADGWKMTRFHFNHQLTLSLAAQDSWPTELLSRILCPWTLLWPLFHWIWLSDSQCCSWILNSIVKFKIVGGAKKKNSKALSGVVLYRNAQAGWSQSLFRFFPSAFAKVKLRFKRHVAWLQNSATEDISNSICFYVFCLKMESKHSLVLSIFMA